MAIIVGEAVDGVRLDKVFYGTIRECLGEESII